MCIIDLNHSLVRKNYCHHINFCTQYDAAAYLVVTGSRKSRSIIRWKVAKFVGCLRNERMREQVL